MITLYHRPQTRSGSIVWLLEELGAPYETKIVASLRGPDGKALRGVDAVMEAKHVSLTLTDGRVTAAITDRDREIAAAPLVRDQKPRRKMLDKGASGPLQPSLFDS